MQKRKKRLPDYAKYKLLKESGGKVDAKLKEIGDEFTAINGALKDDLPKLYAKTKILIEACQRNLIDSQRRWYQILTINLEKPLGQGEEIDPKILELPAITNAFEADYARARDELERIESVIRAVKEATAFSPATTFMTDDLSLKRPSTFNSKRTHSITSDHSIIITSPVPGSSQRQSGNYSSVEIGNTPLIMDPPQMSPTMPSPTGPGRMRAGSTMSSRGPSTPHSVSAQVPTAGYFPPRPATSAGRTPDPTSSQTRISLDAPDQGRSSGQSAFSSQTQNTRTSSIFSSAMPMSDSPTDTRDEALDAEVNEDKVLFLAASLFEFNIAHDRREAGFPYLVYVPGEVRCSTLISSAAKTDILPRFSMSSVCEASCGLPGTKTIRRAPSAGSGRSTLPGSSLTKSRRDHPFTSTHTPPSDEFSFVKAPVHDRSCFVSSTEFQRIKVGRFSHSGFEVK